MIGVEIPNLVTLPVTKSSQYLCIWSGGSLSLVKCKCTSLNLQSPPLNQLLSHLMTSDPCYLYRVSQEEWTKLREGVP